MTDTYPEPLAGLGWDSFFNTQYQNIAIPGAVPCRVTSEFRNSYRITDGKEDFSATMSGRMFYTLTGGYPAVGDWVAAVPYPDGEQAIIHALLPRKSVFSRKAADRAEEQVVAANIDTIFIVSALDGTNFSLRRIERYLTMAWKSGASPVLVLNKVDLCDNPEEFVRKAEEVAMGIPVHPISALKHTGIDSLMTYLGSGQTVAFLGSSGVGKSALTNTLTGREIQETGGVREYDNKGRHTTTRRELIQLPGGGLVIDTPGMKELGMWGNEQDLDSSFEDIEALSRECRFTDCSHTGEPGCAVQQALESGELNQDRYRSYLKLQKELRFIASREDISLRMEEQQRWKRIAKMGKDLKKRNHKGRL